MNDNAHRFEFEKEGSGFLTCWGEYTVLPSRAKTDAGMRHILIQAIEGWLAKEFNTRGLFTRKDYGWVVDGRGDYL